MLKLHRSLFSPVLVAVTLVSRVALADVSDADKAAARELARDGYAALDGRDFARAEERFSRADSLFKAPTIALGLGKARIGLGKFVAAQEALNRVVNTNVGSDASPAFLQSVDEAKRELSALTPRIPSVIIEVKGSDAPTVTVDDTPVPVAALGIKRLLDPGAHVIRARGPGMAVAEVKINLSEGKSETVRLELKPEGKGSTEPVPPKATPEPPLTTPLVPSVATRDQAGSSGSLGKTLGYTSLGIGGAGLILGGITGALVFSQHGTLASECPGGHCSPGKKSDLDTYNMMGTLSTAGFIGGGVLAATGVVLLVTAPKASNTNTAVIPLVGPGYVGLQGSF